jgi:hypothetical protein
LKSKKRLSEIGDVVRLAILKALPDFEDEPDTEQAVQALKAFEAIRIFFLRETWPKGLKKPWAAGMKTRA